jgi:outer membrane protein
LFCAFVVNANLPLISLNSKPSRSVMPNHFDISKKSRPQHHRLALVVALSAAALHCAPAWAVVDAPVREAMQAINAKQAQKAFDLLSPLEASRAGDVDYDAALGIAANEVGQFARAIFALERVLAVQPGNARARAELARAMFAVGDTANARKLLEETKAEGVPDGVNRTIDEFLQAIDKVDEAGRSSIKLHVEAGIGYDSNVNSGPSSNSFAVPALGGAVVTLLATGQKTDASYLHLGAGVSGRAPLVPRWSFIGNASASVRKHGNKASIFNIDQIDGSAGLSYREERNEYSGVLNLGQTVIDGRTLRQITGLTGEWTHRPDGTRQWGTYLQLSNLRYPSQPIRDARRSVLGTSYAQQVSSGMIYYLGGYLGQESINSALVPHLGHKLSGLRGGFQIPIHPQWSVYASAAVESRRYGGTDPLFLVTRSDTQFDLSIGAAWKVSDNWNIKPQINFNRSISNIVVNDSSKSSASITARREF